MRKFSYCIASGEIVPWEDFKDIPGVQFDGKRYRLLGYILIVVQGGIDIIELGFFHPESCMDSECSDLRINMHLVSGHLKLFNSRGIPQANFSSVVGSDSFPMYPEKFIDMVHKIEHQLWESTGYKPRFAGWLLKSASLGPVYTT